MPKPDKASFNVGLKQLTNKFMLATFGEPRTARDYTDTDSPLTNPLLKRNMLSDSVGPFRVTGLKPAVLALAKIMADVSAEQPAVYRVLDSRGMLVVRWVRPNPKKPIPPASQRSISNHSWGCAIDIAMGKGQKGLEVGQDLLKTWVIV